SRDEGGRERASGLADRRLPPRALERVCSSCGEEGRLTRRGRAGAEGQGLGRGGQTVQARDVSR
ncbi:unnamed protein product, partial [Ectocarpus sp. 13 AM-2016]